MLINLFPKLEKGKAVRALRSFFRSEYYIALVALLMVVAELCSLELFVFYCYLILGGTGLLLADDALPLVPIACYSYMTISEKNNPGAHSDTTIFADPSFRAQFIVILAVAALLIVSKLIVSLFTLKRRGSPRLALGFLLLGFGYVLGGLFSDTYSFQTAFFGFVEIASLCALYFYFYFTVDWSKTDASYILNVFLLLGFGMLFEIAGMYGLPGVLKDGMVYRSNMRTGWGIYNNVGCIMAMCVPAPFYFAMKKSNGWVYTLIGSVFMAGVLASQSRGSMLFGAVVYVACLITVIISTRGKERRGQVIFLAAAAFIAALALVAMRENLPDFGDDNGRFKIYRDCYEDFLSSPLFGVGFYATRGYGHWVGFIPPRAHNTVMQLLASGGLFAFLSYVFHRLQTIELLARRPSKAKTTIGFCIASLLLTSLLDCHFFNLGPGLLYGTLLVFAEGDDCNAKINAGERRLGDSAKRLRTADCFGCRLT